MTDPGTLLQQLFNAGALTQQSFGSESRYYGIALLAVTRASGDTVNYVSRRFISPPEQFEVLQRYRVQQGDRVDVVAGTLLGNPLSYWQICDANLAIKPDDVTAVPGAFLSIALPRGLGGGP